MRIEVRDNGPERRKLALAASEIRRGRVLLLPFSEEYLVCVAADAMSTLKRLCQSLAQTGHDAAAPVLVFPSLADLTRNVVTEKAVLHALRSQISPFPEYLALPQKELLSSIRVDKRGAMVRVAEHEVPQGILHELRTPLFALRTPVNDSQGEDAHGRGDDADAKSRGNKRGKEHASRKRRKGKASLPGVSSHDAEVEATVEASAFHGGSAFHGSSVPHGEASASIAAAVSPDCLPRVQGWRFGDVAPPWLHREDVLLLDAGEKSGQAPPLLDIREGSLIWTRSAWPAGQ